MNNKIRNSAKYEECQVRIPGVCNGNPETTVLAHLNGGGMGMKNPDYQGAYCCSDCHDAIDGRTRLKHTIYTDYEAPLILKIAHLEGVIRTQEILREKGLLEVK